MGRQKGRHIAAGDMVFIREALESAVDFIRRYRDLKPLAFLHLQLLVDQAA